MRICLVTQDEPLYLPRAVDLLVQARGRDIVALVLLRPVILNIRQWERLKQPIAVLGPADFLRLGLRVGRARLLDLARHLVPLHEAVSVRQVAERARIPVYQPADINAPEFRLVLATTIRPDVIVSLAASQVFRQPLLRLPPLGCLNVHSAPLPRYRGVWPSFWVLANGETETAVTVHYMTERLDAGAILVQKPVPIRPDDTVHSLTQRTKAAGVEALLEALQLLETHTARPWPQDHAQATVCRFPTPADAARLRSRGRRFF